MQKYIAASAMVLLVLMVIVRVFALRTQGVEAFKFGKIDRKDFIIPPFALAYFYLIFANVFELPTISVGLLFQNEIVTWLGIGFLVMGLAFMLAALISFGKAFRVGIDTGHTVNLVTTGVFRLSRNPIYTAFGLVLTGQFLVYPHVILLAYLAAGIWLFHRQVLREEDFLRNRFGDEFETYCKRVRRYV